MKREQLYYFFHAAKFYLLMLIIMMSVADSEPLSYMDTNFLLDREKIK